MGLDAGGVKDVPFFPYAPYQPQADMSVAVGGFSRHHSEQLPTVEEDEQEEDEQELEDNERVCQCCWRLPVQHWYCRMFSSFFNVSVCFQEH